MKNEILKLSTFVLLLFFWASCDKEEWIEAYLSNTTCLNNLITVATYVHQEGVISTIPNISEESIYIFIKNSSSNEGKYIFPCNLPDQYKIEGLQVIFDGNLKEIIDSVDPNVESMIIAQSVTLTSLKVKL